MSLLEIKNEGYLQKNTTIKDIERGIREVIKQNRESILKNGTKNGQYSGMVDGVKRTIGLKKEELDNIINNNNK